MKVMDREGMRKALNEITPNKFCISCVHKKRVVVSEITKKTQVYCEMQPCKRTLCGYKHIKAHDYACGLYKQV